MKMRMIFSVLVLYALSAMTVAEAGTIIVKPGKFDHFTLEVPERTVAGEGFFIKALVYDLQNNLITNFSESGKDFKVAVTGSATLVPSHLSQVLFRGGTAQISVTDKQAEKIVFSIYQADGTVPLISRELNIVPNKLDHFVVITPGQAVAGDTFEAKIIAKDVFDNTVSDSETAGKNIRVASRGTTSFKILGTVVPDFRSGTASINLVAEKIGTVAVEVQEVLTGSRGLSQNITVNPAAVSSFRLFVPAEAVAGEPFEITVAAHDLYGNQVNDYGSVGNGVTLQSSGSSKIQPSFIKPSEFKGNEAVVKVVYEKAEEMSIIAKELDKNQTGKSQPIRVIAAQADHFVVITPEDAQSGQPFKIRIEAYDRFDNRVRNYNLTGNNVFLKTTGTGVLSPSIISPTEFVDGSALVEVSYDKAESFAISAAMQSEKGVTRTAKEPRPMEEKAPAVAEKVGEKQPVVTAPPVVQKVEEKEQAREKAAEKKAKEARAAEEKKKKVEEARKKIEAAKKAEAAKKEKQIEEAKKEAAQKEEAAKKEKQIEEAKKEAAQKAEAAKKEKQIEEAKKEAAQKAEAAKKEKQIEEAKKEAAKKAEAAKKEKQIEEAKKEAAKKAEAAKKEKQIEEAKKEAAKKEVKQEAKKEVKGEEARIAPQIEAKAEVPKKELKREGKPSNLSNISLIEAKEKAMVVLTLNPLDGNFEYKEGIESRQGKEWLKLRLKPVIRKMEKTVKFKSGFIGDIVIEDDVAEGAVNVYIELTPEKVTFDVARLKNSVIVTVARP